MAAIAGDVLHLIPQPLDRIEFGTVGRQGQQMNPVGQAGIARTRVKARLILDDHMLGSGIAGGKANWCSGSSCRRSSAHDHRRRGHASWHNQPDDNQKIKGQKNESITSNISTT